MIHTPHNAYYILHFHLIFEQWLQMNPLTNEFVRNDIYEEEKKKLIHNGEQYSNIAAHSKLQHNEFVPARGIFLCHFVALELI